MKLETLELTLWRLTVMWQTLEKLHFLPPPLGDWRHRCSDYQSAGTIELTLESRFGPFEKNYDHELWGAFLTWDVVKSNLTGEARICVIGSQLGTKGSRTVRTTQRQSHQTVRSLAQSLAPEGRGKCGSTGVCWYRYFGRRQSGKELAVNRRFLWKIEPQRILLGLFHSWLETNLVTSPCCNTRHWWIVSTLGCE